MTEWHATMNAGMPNAFSERDRGKTCLIGGTYVMKCSDLQDIHDALLGNMAEP
jgi:hypothetical protein